MKSEITDDMKPQKSLLEQAPRRYSFPRYGNFYSNFSTLWTISVHGMEKVGRATARTRRGRCCYQEPSPRIGDKMHNNALHRTAHKVRRPVKADVVPERKLTLKSIVMLLILLTANASIATPEDESTLRQFATGIAVAVFSNDLATITNDYVEAGSPFLGETIKSWNKTREMADYRGIKWNSCVVTQIQVKKLVSSGDRRIADVLVDATDGNARFTLFLDECHEINGKWTLFFLKWREEDMEKAQQSVPAYGAQSAPSAEP